MTISSPNNDFTLVDVDSLYCNEVLDDVQMEYLEEDSICTSSPFVSVEQGLISEDEELLYLLKKEKETPLLSQKDEHADSSSFGETRLEGIHWMLKIKARYDISALTCVLCINFFDRYMISTVEHRKEEDIHLALATCLSLATKVNEVTALHPRDLQGLNSKYVLEAKAIYQKEINILKNLEWRMHPITAFSFLDHVIGRLGLETHLQEDFYKKCEDLILSVVADWKSIRYLPSFLATSTMLHVMQQVEPLNADKYHEKILSIFRTSKEQIKECYELMENISNTFETNLYHRKRKREE